MGLLDDAIREHLELKRRRGGDPAEIERAERDALGPVRREPEPLAPAEYDEPDAAAPEFAGDLQDEPAGYELPYEDAVGDDFGEPYAPRDELSSDPATARGAPPAEPFGLSGEEDPWVAPPPPEPAGEAMPHEHFEADPFEDPHHDPLPEPADPPAAAQRPPATPPPVTPAPVAPPPVAPPPDHLNQPTAEYRLEPGHPEPEAGEDVLEETPEFLQDAPEHDRLWFEQRPPRDFDFDN